MIVRRSLEHYEYIFIVALPTELLRLWLSPEGFLKQNILFLSSIHSAK
jgi:hypothetical protein